MDNLFYLYFHDLTPEAQEQYLEHFGLTIHDINTSLPIAAWTNEYAEEYLYPNNLFDIEEE